MTKQRVDVFMGQRARYGADTVEVLGTVGQHGDKGWRIRVRVVGTTREMLAHPALLEPIRRPSTRRGRTYLGYIEREFRKAKQEAEAAEERMLS